jgi:uncharacterized protein
MIAVDTNILVYMHRVDFPLHTEAKLVVEELRSHSAHWAIPWPCVHEFISVVTNPRIFVKPTPIQIAFAVIENLAENGNLEFLSESDGYFEKLQSLATAAKVTGAKIHDARIGALCIHHGISELWSADRDFSSFPKLKVRNPLIYV